MLFSWKYNRKLGSELAISIYIVYRKIHSISKFFLLHPACVGTNLLITSVCFDKSLQISKTKNQNSILKDCVMRAMSALNAATHIQRREALSKVTFDDKLRREKTFTIVTYIIAFCIALLSNTLAIRLCKIAIKQNFFRIVYKSGIHRLPTI